MIIAYVPGTTSVDRHELLPGQTLPGGSVWFDMGEPAPEERLLVERALSVELPTREEMFEIEPSSRLYTDGGAIFITATSSTHADRPDPTSDVMTFVLARGPLVTLRYVHPKPVATFSARIVRQPGLCASAEKSSMSPARILRK